MTVEEVEEQPDAVIGKFLVNSFTAVVFFDTGASHSYISRGFVNRYMLPTQVLKTPMLVSSPGVEYMAHQGCFQTPCFPLRPDSFGVRRIGCDTRYGLAYGLDINV